MSRRGKHSEKIYDPQIRSQLQTGQPFPAKNNKGDKLDINKDGSVDLYFGAKAPEGKEANWIQTVPKKGWFACLRLYEPLNPWFDKTWQPGEFELIKCDLDILGDDSTSPRIVRILTEGDYHYENHSYHFQNSHAHLRGHAIDADALERPT